MTDQSGKIHGTLGVGSRVQLTVRSVDAAADLTCTGVVIEDYASMVIDSVAVGRNWGLVHRWAVALDDGRLVFVNDEDLRTSG
ncbi:hypothetical protein [Rhodococcus qingshengii]|uniref:hypothetical protein n=1 Tax=Rhodococcus qingshengii TaxID=334542 RepID=UPI00237C9BF8|nr:hypothetical protein [Rhodococcus qingshengii]WCT06090.1 hypothetical protein PI247_31315 [Rhodococcus qingshengii]